VSRPDSALTASLVYGTSTYQDAARQINAQGAEIDRLRRIVALIPPYRQPPVYSNYLPPWRRGQTGS
jgi:hypothetical protein